MDSSARRSWILALTLSAGCFQPADDGSIADASGTESESGQGSEDEVGTSSSESGTDTGESTSETDGSESPTCVDQDQDGFGDNCEAGPDCDDSDPFNFSETGCLTCVDDTALEPEQYIEVQVQTILNGLRARPAGTTSN